MSSAPQDNPLLERRFRIPFPDIRAEHVEPAILVSIAGANEAITRLVADPGPRTYESTLGGLETATAQVEWCVGIVAHLESVATSPALRAAYASVQAAVAEFYASIPLNAGLWRAIQEFAATPEAAGLSGTRRRHLEKTIEEFRREGAGLDSDGKARLAAIDVALAKATKRFSENVLDSTHAFELVVTNPDQLTGLPPSALAAARQSAESKDCDGHRFTLQAPSLIAVLTHLDDRSIRESMWRAHNMRATANGMDNRPLIEEILGLRRERADLLGFESFPALVLSDRMAKTPGRARDFVEELRRKTEPFFRAENEALASFAAQRGLEGSVQPWDVAYYAEKQRKAKYEFDDEILRPYFSVDRVVQGLFSIAQRLYGIRITHRGDLPVWHPMVQSYSICDGSGRELGAFYLDLFPRETKSDGAWMNELATAVPGDPDIPAHLGTICANFTPPIGDAPALLVHREVETLFHEFGHLMHLCLSTVEVRSRAGSRVAWDFVELPSQIMENWCWEREALDLFARHVETGEAIPVALFDRLRRARTYRAANDMMRQLGFAALDLALHLDYDIDRDGDVTTYARQVLQPFAPVPYPADYAMVASFQHLFAHSVGYASGYYSYKWAEVLDADAFSRFQTEGILNPEVGKAFRTCILERGDGEDPMNLYRAFMGREPRLEPLLRRAGLGSPP